MLGPYELLEEVMNYAEKNQNKGKYKLTKNGLWNFIIKIDPKADKINMEEVVRELDARGWLLQNSNEEIEFDPACFQK